MEANAQEGAICSVVRGRVRSAMASGPRLWLRDELFEHGILHVPVGDAKRVTPAGLGEAVAALTASSAPTLT